MRSDDWHLTEDPDDFLARAGEFLRSRPALHTMPLTVIESLRTRGADAYGAEAPVFGRLERAGEVRATFYRKPPGLLSLTPSPPSTPTPSLPVSPASATNSPASARSTAPPQLSPRHGSGTRARHRRRAHIASACTAWAR